MTADNGRTRPRSHPDISGFETSGHIDHQMSSPVGRLAMIVRLKKKKKKFYLKSNKIVNITLANSLLYRLHTQYFQQYVHQFILFILFQYVHQFILFLFFCLPSPLLHHCLHTHGCCSNIHHRFYCTRSQPFILSSLMHWFYSYYQISPFSLLMVFWDYWLNSDDSTGNNDIVGHNEGPTADMCTSCLRESKVLWFRCKNR